MAAAPAAATRASRVLDLPRAGKAGALNTAVARRRGEILVFSDANSMLAPDALRRARRAVRRPAGRRGGRRSALPGRRRRRRAWPSGERGYWDLDRAIKRAESRAGNVISATGAIYAVRRELFRAGARRRHRRLRRPRPRVICQGRRLVFAPGAVAYEPVGALGRGRVRAQGAGHDARAQRRAAAPRAAGPAPPRLLRAAAALAQGAAPADGGAAGRDRRDRRAPGPPRRRSYSRSRPPRTPPSSALGAAGLLLGRRAPRHRLLALPAYFCLVNLASLQAAANVVRRRAHRPLGAAARAMSASGSSARPWVPAGQPARPRACRPPCRWRPPRCSAPRSRLGSPVLIVLALAPLGRGDRPADGAVLVFVVGFYLNLPVARRPRPRDRCSAISRPSRCCCCSRSWPTSSSAAGRSW